MVHILHLLWGPSYKTSLSLTDGPHYRCGLIPKLLSPTITTFPFMVIIYIKFEPLRTFFYHLLMTSPIKLDGCDCLMEISSDPNGVHMAVVCKHAMCTDSIFMEQETNTFDIWSLSFSSEWSPSWDQQPIMVTFKEGKLPIDQLTNRTKLMSIVYTKEIRHG